METPSIAVEPQITYTFSVMQLFRFHLGDTRPQRIGLLDYRKIKTDSWVCLTNSMNTKPLVSIGDELYTRSRIVRCNDHSQQQLFNLTLRLPMPKKRKRQFKRQLSVDLLTIANNDKCLSYSVSSTGPSAIPFWAECRSQLQKIGESSVRQIFRVERSTADIRPEIEQ